MLRLSRIALVICSCLILPLIGLTAGTVENEINDIKIVSGESSLRLEISTVGDVAFDAFTMNEPRRLVVDCVGARYKVPWSEKEIEHDLAGRVRTSQFKVDPEFVSRIVIDLRTNVDYRTWAEGDKQVLELTARAEAAEEAEAVTEAVQPAIGAAIVPEEERPAQETEQPVSPASMGPVLPLVTPVAEEEKPAEVAEEEKPVEEKKPERADEQAAPQEQAENAQISSPWLEEPVTQEQPPAQTKAADEVQVLPPAPSTASDVVPWAEPYMRGAPAGGGGVGMGSRRITLDAQGADIKTVLRTIAEFAGVNIIAGSDVQGDVYVHIKDAPWEEALDILLKAHGYGWREEYGMIRVAEISRLTKEELELQQAEKKKDDLLPLMTRIIFVHNSDADEIATALQNVVSQRGYVDVDLASNALVVIDIERNLKKIEEIVRTLDKKHYQVDINAKLVEIDVEASRQLGITWGFANLHASGFSGAGSADVNADLPMSVGNLRFGTVRSWGEFNVLLETLERTNKANLISNPRITTMDNREASILVGKEIPLIVADEAGNPITELTKIGIMLRVIPHVNADRTITMDLHPEVSDLQSESTAQGGVIIATSEADTRVIVEDGETAVIGGLIKEVESELKTGVPYLKDVPGIGWLFSSNATASKKQELVIFVTPTIVE